MHQDAQIKELKEILFVIGELAITSFDDQIVGLVDRTLKLMGKVTVSKERFNEILGKKENLNMSTEEHETNKAPSREGLKEAERLSLRKRLFEDGEMGVIIETDLKGGKQSMIKGRMTDLPPRAIIEISKVMGEGSIAYPREKNGTPNWRLISSMSNLDHALEHAMKALVVRNNLKPDSKYILTELSHFAARALMTLEMFIKETL